MQIIKKAFRFILLFVVLIVLYLAGVILYGTLTEFKPTPGSVQKNVSAGNTQPMAEIDSIIDLLCWNIGYGGLGKETDFFYDGGKTVRAPRNIWNKDFQGQINLIKSNDTIDFFLIQEIDVNSRRSYEINQYDSLLKILYNYTGNFAVNYDVNFVPVPYLEPMGKVYGGVATYSRFPVSNSNRYQYPGKFPWPTRIFFLDRCFLEQRIQMKNGKELIIINTHNSAYDETGEIKNAEMVYLKKYLEEEYKKGNYIIAGGDWNQCPPNFQFNKFEPVGGYNGFMPPSMSFDYTPENWLWAYDPDVPTNRHLETPLNDKTFRTVIDFFLVSPNIEILKVKTIDTKFEYSDHQPVVLKVKMR